MEQQQPQQIFCVGGNSQSEGRTVADFTVCARAGHYECIRRLLVDGEREATEARATKLLLSPAGDASLLQAAVRGHSQVVSCIVSERLRLPPRLAVKDAETAVTELTCYWVTTPLRLACREGHEATARAILDLLPCCVVRQALRRDPPGRTPAFLVTPTGGGGGEDGDAAVPTTTPEGAATAPHNGATNGDANATKLLDQCLLDAAGAGRTNVLELLVERKADLTARVKGNLPVVLAASRGHTEATLAMLSAMRRQCLLLQRTQGQCKVAGAVEVAEILAVVANDPALAETLEKILAFLARPGRLAVQTFLLCNNRLDGSSSSSSCVGSTPVVKEQRVEEAADYLAGGAEARPAPGVSSKLNQPLAVAAKPTGTGTGTGTSTGSTTANTTTNTTTNNTTNNTTTTDNNNTRSSAQVFIRDQWIRFKIAMLALDQPVHDKVDWIVSAAHDPNQLQTPLMVAAEANNLRGVQALLASKASPLLRSPLSAWQIAVSYGHSEVARVLAQHMIPPRCPALSGRKPFVSFDFSVPVHTQLPNASHNLVQVSDEHIPSLKDHLLVDICSRPGARCRVAPCVDFLMALGERTCGFRSRHGRRRGVDGTGGGGGGGGDSEASSSRPPPGARAVHHECIRWLIQAKAALDTETIQRCSMAKLKTLLAAKAALAPSAAMDEEVLRRVINVYPEALNYPTAKDGCTGGWPSHRPLTMAVHLAYGSDTELQQFRLILNAPGIDVNATGPTDGMSALATAAEMGLCLEMNSLLLAKAHVHMPRTACHRPLPDAVANVYVRPPLMSAVMERSTGCVRQLLDAHADPNTVDVDMSTVLSIAAMNGFTSITKLLLNAKASTGIDIADFGDHTALYGAAQEGHLAEVRILLQAKASVNACGKDGTPLFIACQENHVEVVQVLLGAKADPTLCLVGLDPAPGSPPPPPPPPSPWSEGSHCGGGGGGGGFEGIDDPDHHHQQQQHHHQQQLKKVGPGVRWSPLFVAAGSGFLNVVDLLLRHSPTTSEAAAAAATAAPPPPPPSSSSGHSSSLTMLETCTRQQHFYWGMLVPAGLNPVDIARLRGHMSVVERLQHFRREQLGN